MRVALLQFSAGTDSALNRKTIDGLVGRLADGPPVDLVVAPEGSMHDFGTIDHDLGAAAEPLDGPFVGALAEHAARLHATVVAGMFERNGDGLPWNTLVVMAPDGTLAATYRKVHLYDSFGYTESERLSAGDIKPVTLEVGGLRLGLMTCYDLRFPEYARLLVDEGAEALVVPSAWVAGPLKEDHWGTLLRARAIENTTYVLGAGQCGATYTGCTAVVDPLGVVVAAAGHDEAVVTADLEPDRIARARQRNPSLANRRM
ncbi:MAG: carbon-nitrogen hydrolase family protein [Nocardioidaceae bacterium]